VKGDDAAWFTGRDRWFDDEAQAPAPGEPERDLGTVHEPARETPVHEETDVLVVGGGPAGCAAALAARRAGARVTLVERYNHLGGLSTGGLVIWIDRMTDWSGEQVIAGFAREILDRLPDGAVMGAPRDLWGSQEPGPVAHWRERLGGFRDTVTWSPLIDPEWLKLVSAELLVAEGVRLVLHSWVVAPIADGDGDGRRLGGAIFESKQGRRAIRARAVVDATGDLDVVAGAGVPYESDVEGGGSNVQHCINTAWTWAGVDMNRWLAFKAGDPAGYREFMRAAGEELGFVEAPYVAWRDDVCVFMGPRLPGYSALRVDDMTTVELESRRRMAVHLDVFRRSAPGFERAWLLLSAPQLGVRHTRRLVGRRRMTVADWREGVVHEDEIGVSPSPSAKFANVSVPYGAIVPAHLDNVLVGGRHVATDPQTQSFMREIPQCWLTGQAAGAAAAMVSATGAPAAEVDVRALQDELRRQGAYVRAGARAPA